MVGENNFYPIEEHEDLLPYVTVQFGLTREDPKCKYSMESTVPYFPEMGDGELDEIGQQFVHFLRQAGFLMPNDYLLMESLTDEECDLLAATLDEYRKKE